MNTNQQETVRLLQNTLEHERKNSDTRDYKEFLQELHDAILDEAEQIARQEQAQRQQQQPAQQAEPAPESAPAPA